MPRTELKGFESRSWIVISDCFFLNIYRNLLTNVREMQIRLVYELVQALLLNVSTVRFVHHLKGVNCRNRARKTIKMYHLESEHTWELADRLHDLGPCIQKCGLEKLLDRNLACGCFDP
jgi:hypothetical protein